MCMLGVGLGAVWETREGVGNERGRRLKAGLLSRGQQVEGKMSNGWMNGGPWRRWRGSEVVL